MNPDVQSTFDIDGLEAPLPELARLRRTSRYEVPPRGLREQVRTRVRATVSGTRRPVALSLSLRPLVLAAVVFLLVPSAIAATGLGGKWVQRVMAYLPWYAEHSARQEGERGKAEHRAGSRERSAASPNAGREVAIGEETPAPELDSAKAHELATGQELAASEPGKPTASAAHEPATSGGQQPDPTPMHAVTPGRARHSRGALPETDTPRPVSDDTSAAASHPRSSATWNEDDTSNESAHHSSLQQERVLLERARLRLSAGDAAGVLALTAEHERRFPAGLLTRERLRLRDQARALLEHK